MINDAQPWKSPKTSLSMREHCWANFNARTTELFEYATSIGVIGIQASALPPSVYRTLEKAFERYIVQVQPDIARISRMSLRKRRAPSWFDVDDVAGEVRGLIWKYLFEREAPRVLVRVEDGGKKIWRDLLPGEHGVVGFSADKANSPGTWLRWKVTRNLWKELSKRLKECQHCRGLDSAQCTSCAIDPALAGYGPKRRSRPPEYLSKTGELPELGDGEEASAEARCDRARQREKLKTLAKTAREFAMLEAITRGGGEVRVVAYLIEAKLYDDPEIARRAINAFVSEFTKKHAPRARGVLAA